MRQNHKMKQIKHTHPAERPVKVRGVVGDENIVSWRYCMLSATHESFESGFVDLIMSLSVNFY